jgi:hypothetical protein
MSGSVVLLCVGVLANVGYESARGLLVDFQAGLDFPFPRDGGPCVVGDVVFALVGSIIIFELHLAFLF